MRPTTIVLGPKTRLGSELARQLRGQPVIAVARDARDAATIRTREPFAQATVVDGADGLVDEVGGLGQGPLRLVVCALGPVHPDLPQTARDAARVMRDLDFVEQVLATGRPVQVVLVSTVLALAPGSDRRYYGGWKALVEQQVQQIVDDRRSAGQAVTLSVLYPGRLLDASERKGRRRLHTSYQQLATDVLALPESPALGKVVGMDARFWLLVRSISLLGRSLSTSSTRLRRPPQAG